LRARAGCAALFANVSWTVHGVACDFPNGVGNQCITLPKNESHKDCEDVGPFLNPAGEETMKMAPPTWISRAVHIDPIDISGAGQCTPVSPSQRFQFAGSPIANASGGGTSASISAVRGLATVGQSCGSDGCFPASLDAFNVDLADMTVAGTALTNLSVSLTQSAPLVDAVDDAGNAFLGIVSDALQLRVVGKKAGVDSIYSARNQTLGIVNFGPDGSPLPVIINVDASAVPATTQTLTCANASSISKLFGFDADYTWTVTSSAGTLSLVTSPITQGCAAQGLRGQGFMTIDSIPFSTRGLVTNAAASVDLFIPPNQPNHFWQGQLQMYLSCPSGNFFHQFVGQADVTGKPTNRFSTMRIPLTSGARTVLGQTHDDCSIQYALNVNDTGQTWVFDNLRFTP
jgi:hypothetical protein